MVTHRVSGSLPSCSFVAPVVLLTAAGTVIGIVVPHLLPPAVYTVTGLAVDELLGEVVVLDGFEGPGCAG
jgi:hypothetical protein